MFQKIKNWAGSKYVAVAAAVGSAIVPAFAEDPTTATVISSFGTGMTTIANNAMSMISTIVPIALGVAGVIFLVRKAMGWFKSLAK
jgi:hypothetical protein